MTHVRLVESMSTVLMRVVGLLLLHCVPSLAVPTRWWTHVPGFRDVGLRRALKSERRLRCSVECAG